MSQQVIKLSCPGCGAGIEVNQEHCEYCKSPVLIHTFNSVHTMPLPQVNKYANTYRKALAENPDHQVLNASVAFCYLRLKLYDKALPTFEKAMEDNFDNAEVFFYAAVCLLKGRKAFVTQRADIDKIEEYLQAALMLEPKGIYYYFQAYIKYDYFHRKYLNSSPNYEECLQMAAQNGVSEGDIEQLFAILEVPRPESL